MMAHLPLELLTFCILPQLDQVSLARLAKTCTRMRSAVHTFLLKSKTLDMKDVIYWIETENRLVDCSDALKAAFMFLTRNTSVISLRKLKMWGHPDQPTMVNLNTIRKLIKQNRNLEELSLVNMKLTDHLMDVIMKLPKLKYLQLSPALINKGSNPYVKIKELKQKGCEITGVGQQREEYWKGTARVFNLKFRNHVN
eukprot:GFUD01019642.1.p1 GENE.GFUD01019642.1~~GFUD01019642.1.p1  ORF type:complete len:197 (+),score=48.70 GFUD01019642.1:208-798(+)